MNGLIHESLCQIGLIWCALLIIGGGIAIYHDRIRAALSLVCQVVLLLVEPLAKHAQRKREKRRAASALRFINQPYQNRNKYKRIEY